VKRVFEIEWDGTWNPDRDWEEIDLAAVKREARLEALETLRNIECKTCAAGIEFDERSHLHVEGQVCYALWIRRLIAAAEEEGKK
jgi:hypothetical protein